METILSWLLENIPWLAPTIVGVVIAWKLSGWKKGLDDTKNKVESLPCETRRESIFTLNKDMERVMQSLEKMPCEASRKSIFSLDKDIEHVKERLEELPCEAHGKTMSDNRSDIEKHFAESDAIIAEHTRRLDKIEIKLERWNEKMMDIALVGAGSARKHSPYTLTPFGKYLLDKSFGVDCIDENLDFFFSQIDEQPHSTPYDVERSALGAVMDSFRTDMTNSVKNFIYNAPAKIKFNGEDYEMTTTDVQVAMALYLRDKYLERNTNALSPSNEVGNEPEQNTNQ